MRRRYYYQPVPDDIAQAICKPMVWMPLRAYIFAFEPSGTVASSPADMAKRISEFSKQTGDVHVHGIFVGGSAYYSTVAVDPRTAKPVDFYHVKFLKKDLLSAFKWAMLHDLSRFPRHPDNWTPAIDKYNERKQRWAVYPAVSDKTS